MLIGIGNLDRGDDAAGWAVAGSVSTWQVERRVAGSFDLLDLWNADDEVVIVDAMSSGASPGTVHMFDVTEEALPSYQTMINRLAGTTDLTGVAQTPWALWSRAWTAEENRHGDLLNKYL